MYNLDIYIHFRLCIESIVCFYVYFDGKGRGLVIDSLIVELVSCFFPSSTIMLRKTFYLYVDASPHPKVNKF